MAHSSASTSPHSFAKHALQLLQNVQRRISPVELVYTTHQRWPFRPGQVIHTRPTLHISVLDSSFNPPTLAHLTLANSHPPPSSRHSAATSASAEPYDARMLLLSTRNADKFLKPGDPTFVQRLEMMRLLLNDIHSNTTEHGEFLQMSENTAIAVIDEPTFAGKSMLLLRFLQTRLVTVTEFSGTNSTSDEHRDANKRYASYPSPLPKLIFLLGSDTLVRLFSPKYYPSEQAMVQMLRTFLSADQEDCRIVCANRQSANADKTPQEPQDKMFEIVHEFINSGRIALINIGPKEQTYSSSEVRAKVAARDDSWKQLVTDAIADYIIKQGIYSSSERG